MPSIPPHTIRLPTIEEIEAELGRELEPALPPADEVKKVERRLTSMEKNSLKIPDMLISGAMP